MPFRTTRFSLKKNHLNILLIKTKRTQRSIQYTIINFYRTKNLEMNYSYIYDLKIFSISKSKAILNYFYFPVIKF